MNLKDEKGLTLVELLIAGAITALIGGMLSTAIYQFIMTSERGNEKLEALHDVQNAGYWLTRDGLRAETINLVDGAPPADNLTLTWTNEGQTHTITYSLSGTDLERARSGNITTIAHNVADIEFSIDGMVMTVAMTSTPEGRWGVSEEVTFTIWLRPTG